MAFQPMTPAGVAPVPFKRFSELVFVSAAGHLAFALFYGLVCGDMLVGAVLALGGVLMGSLYLVFRSSLPARCMRRLAHAVLLADLVVVTLSLAWTGLPPMGAAWWLVWWPLFAVHMLGVRDGLWWGPLTLVAGGLLWANAHHQWVLARLPATESPVLWMQVGFMLVGLGVGWVVRRAHEGYHRDIARQQATISAQQAALSSRAQELEGMLQAVQQASLDRTRLFAQISHEVRTPLNGLLGFAQLLDLTALDETQRSHLRHIHQCGDTLLHMVNELLDFSRLESRSDALSAERIDVSNLVDEALGMVRPMATAKGVGLRCEFLTLPEAVVGDPLRLKQVLLNLLANAIKFSSQGFVTLRCRGSLGADGGAVLCVEVQDEGVGVPAEALPHLFEPFSEATQRTWKRHGGTGLGLAICRRLVQRMGGRIGVQSQLGVGSLFWFEIPAEGRGVAPVPPQAVVCV